MREQRFISQHKIVHWVALGGLVLAIILAPFFVFGKAVDTWAETLLRGPGSYTTVYGLILGSMLALDIILPVPSSLVSTGLGALLGWIGGFVVSTLGMTAACWLGYCMGRSVGRGAARRLVSDHELALLEAAWTRWGSGVILLFRAVPALGEASAIFAGMSRMPQDRFLLLSVLSNAGISFVYATVGAFAANTQSFLLAFAGAVLLPSLVLFATHRFAVVSNLTRGEKTL